MQTDILNKIRARIEMRIGIIKDKEKKAVSSRNWGASYQLEAQIAILEEALIYFEEEYKSTENEKI